MAVKKDAKKELSKKSEKEEEVKAEIVSEDKENEEEEAEAEESAEAEETEESEEVEESEDSGKSEPKAKKDRVPYVMIALIYAIILGMALYFILPAVFAPSFGYTLDEYNTRLQNSDISNRMKASYTTIVPQFKIVDKNSIKEIWSIKGEIAPEEQAKLDARFKPFVKTLAATEELENILVEANTRVSDGKLTRLCMYCTYDDSHMSMMMVHFGALLGNFFPGMTFADAVSLIMNSAMVANTDGLYTVKGDIAYRLCADNVGGKTYIKIEVLPAKALKPSQILATQPEAPAASETTAASSAS